MKIAVTGTRQTDVISVDGLERLFERFLRPFASPDAHWYLGGASGIDTLVLAWLLEHSASALSVGVPVRVADQPADAQAGIAIARRQGRLAQVVELAHPAGLGDAAYNARNAWLVDHAEFVIGFPLTGQDDGSGTWSTLTYAGTTQRPRLIVPLNSH